MPYSARKTISNYSLLGRLFIFIALAALLLGGCGTTRSLYEKVIPGKAPLKKQIMIFPFIDQMGLGEERTGQMYSRFVDLLKASSYLTVLPPAEGMNISGLHKGAGKDPAVIKKAEELGVHALVMATLSPFEVTTERKGLWPFRKWKKTYEITMAMEVVDPTGGPLLMSHEQSEKISISLEEAELQQEGQIKDKAFQKALPDVLKDQASFLEKALRKEPWTGKILAAEEGIFVINAGHTLGLKPDQCFEIYTRGERITAKDGRTYETLGKRIGVIRVNVVEENRSKAVPVEGKELAAGQIIRPCP